MRSRRKEWLAGYWYAGARRPIVPCLVLALLAGGFGLQAKGKESRRARREQERNQASQPAQPGPVSGNKEPVQVPPAREPVKDPATGPAGTQPAKSVQSAEQIPAQDKQQIARKSDDASRLAAGDAQAASPLATALEAARSSRDTLRKLPGYTCTFTKQEQIKKNSLTKQSMMLKFRREPFSVYLKYVDPNPGRQVLFVEGRNDGKFYFKEASGFLSYMGTISLLPTSSDAMKENRYPITMIGMENMLEKYIRDWEESLKHPDTQVRVYPLAKLGEVDCQMFEVVHPQQREPFKFHAGRVYFDKKTNFPIRTEKYAFPVKAGADPQLVEAYNYSDVKPLDGPSERDFDVKNGTYGFK